MNRIEKRVVNADTIKEWREMAATQNAKILQHVKRQLNKKDKAIFARLQDLENEINKWGNDE